MRSKAITIAALGAAQILGWGTSFYFPAVLAPPIVADTGWSLGWVVSGTTLGLLVAGLMAPRVGAFIDRHGGRPSFAASSLLFSAGLACIGLAPSLPVFLFGWVVVGLGMGTGLYDAAFATLGKLYGSDARMPITNLTLIGGFASTVCWPLSAFLAEAFGWRGACFVYAVLHLAVSLPLQMAVVPPLARSAGGFDATSDTSGWTPAIAPGQRLPFVLLALVLTLASGIGSIVIVHFMIFLQARGADLALAVALGTLFGPSQVGARIVERLFGSRYHPIWTMVASCVLMALGIGMLSGGFPWLVLTILVYGGGYGIMWIARGTLPLALFGAERYATLMGRLAFPALVVQALAPSAGAWAVERHGAESVMEWLTALAVVNVVLILLLWAWRRRPADRI